MSSTMVVPANVPDTSGARLPATYEAARKAIEECARLDECRDWADKAAALRAYARMRDDKTLHNYALRIEDRAIRRFGKLYKELYPNRSQDNLVQNRRNADDRKSVNPPREWPSDGSTAYQRRTALNVAAVPEPDFERLVEGPNPPSKTQLAELGTAKRTVVRDPEPSQPFALGRGVDPHQALKAFAEFCEHTDPVALARTVSADAETVSQYVAIADRWLDQFVANLAPGG